MLTCKKSHQTAVCCSYLLLPWKQRGTEGSVARLSTCRMQSNWVCALRSLQKFHLYSGRSMILCIRPPLLQIWHMHCGMQSSYIRGSPHLLNGFSSGWLVWADCSWWAPPAVMYGWDHCGTKTFRIYRSCCKRAQKGIWVKLDDAIMSAVVSEWFKKWDKNQSGYTTCWKQLWPQFHKISDLKETSALILLILTGSQKIRPGLYDPLDPRADLSYRGL